MHSDHQRQGIAQTLYNLLEHQARNQQCPSLTIDGSITALPFFEKQVFVSLQQQAVWMNGVSLTNFEMKKNLV